MIRKPECSELFMRLAEEAEQGGGGSRVLMNRELTVHRRAAIVEQALVSRPGVNGRVNRLKRPRHIPRPLTLILFLPPGTVRNYTRMELALAVIPGVHVEDLPGMARTQARRPGHVQRITSQEIIACGVKRRQVTLRSCRFLASRQCITDGSLQHPGGCLLAYQHRHVPVPAPPQRAL